MAYDVRVVGAIAVAIIVYLAAALPLMPAGEPFTLSRLPRMLKNRLLVTVYVVTMLFATGYYTCYSYIEPFLHQVASFDSGMITMSLTVFGFAGILGSMLFSRFYDGKSRPFLALSIAGVALALAGLRLWQGASLRCSSCSCCGAAAVRRSTWHFRRRSSRVSRRMSRPSPCRSSRGLFNFGIGAGSALRRPSL